VSLGYMKIQAHHCRYSLSEIRASSAPARTATAGSRTTAAAAEDVGDDVEYGDDHLRS